MANANATTFEARLRRIDRRHRKLAHGYVASVNHDGLIIAKPRRRAPKFPWQGLVFTASLLLLFKAGLFFALGETSYAQRVDQLREGTFVEQAGAFVMQADPVTLWISDQIAALIS